MKSLFWIKSQLCLLAILGVVAFQANGVRAEEKASLSIPSIQSVNPGVPGGASKATGPAPKAAFVSKDPNAVVVSSPKVSIAEHAETFGLKTLNQTVDAAQSLIPILPSAKTDLDSLYVFGKDDRQQVTNTTAYPYSTICSLLMTFPNGQQRIGSGAFISYKSVLTAGHCVYDPSLGGWARSIQVMPGRNGTSLPFGSGWAARLHSVTGWTSNSDRNYDYGAIEMSDTSLGNRVGYLGYAVESDGTLTNQQNVFNTAGFPGDKGGTKMYYTNGQFSSVTSTLVRYYFDTYGGQSGSPIWELKNGNRYVVGIVTAEYTDGSAANIGTRVNNNVFNFIHSQP